MTYFSRFILFFGFLSFILPIVAFAGFPFFPSASNPLLPCTGGGSAFENFVGGLPGRPRCTSICQLLVLGQNVIYAAMTYVVFFLAPILFAWAGGLIMLDGGSGKRLSEGKSLLKGTAIGLAIMLCSFVIVQTFLFVIGQVSLSGQPTSGAWVQWGNISCQSIQQFIPGQTPNIQSPSPGATIGN